VSTIGYATMPIIPSLRGMDRQIQSQLGGLNAAAGQAGSQAGESLSSRFGGAVRDMASSAGRVLEDMFTGVAVAGGGVLAASLFKGWDRLTTIQDSTAALTVSLGDATAAAQVLDDVLEVVRGTPFNLDQFARAAQLMVGMGVEAEKVPAYLTAIGEAAATQGGRAGEFADRLSEVFGQITARGRVQLRDVWRISETGVNALVILANHFGITTEAMQDMISAGAVPAEEALDALAAGILEGSDGIAGSTRALEGTMAGLRETLSGSAGGFGAAMARFGASIIEPFSGALTEAFKAGADLLDELGERIGRRLQGIGESPGFQRFMEGLKDIPALIGPAIDRLRDLGPFLAPLGAAIAALGAGGLARALGPFGAIIPTISPALAAFVAFVVTTPELREAFGRLGEALGELMVSLGEALLPLIVKLAEVAIPFLVVVIDQFLIPVIGFLTDNSWLAVAAMGAVVLLAKPVLGAVGLVFAAGAAVKWVYDNVEGFKGLVDDFVDWVNGDARPAIRGMEEDLEGARPVTSLFTDGIEERVPLMEQALGRIKLTLIAHWTTITSALEAIWEKFGDDIVRMAGSMWDTIVEIVEGVFQILIGAFDVGLGVLAGDWDAFWGGLISVVTGAVSLITAPTRLMMRLMQDIIGAALGVIDEKWKATWYVMPGIILASLSAAVRWVVEKLGEIVRFFSLLPAWIVTVVGAYAHQLVLLGQAIVGWIVRGINSVSNQITQAILNAIPGASTVFDKVVGSLGNEVDYRINPKTGKLEIIRHAGGLIPGPRGAEVPVRALGGEMVLTEGQQARLFDAIASGAVGDRRDGLHIENLHIGTHDDLIEARSKLAMLAIQMGA
jgi:tape measure domain-containing protein